MQKSRQLRYRSKAPLVSVIMPVYNKRPYIRRAIESVRRQSFMDWELIIVDDGSTDDSATEVPTNDRRIRLYRQENVGPAAARNNGVKLAKGKYLTFLDADDYYYKNKLEREINIMCNHKVDWILSALHLKKNERTIYYGIKFKNGNSCTDDTVIVNNAVKELTLRGTPPDGLCIKKSLYEHVGGFNEEMRCYEITEFMIRCALVKPMMIVNMIPSYCVVRVPNSASTITQDHVMGMRQLGNSYLNLSRLFTDYEYMLKNLSKKCLFYYTFSLIEMECKRNARYFLLNEYPYSRDKIWVTLRVASILPTSIIKSYVLLRKILSDFRQVLRKRTRHPKCVFSEMDKDEGYQI